MIALFNNTKLQWRCKNNSKKSSFAEISIGTKTRDGDFKNLKISVPSTINMDAVAVTNSKEMHSVYSDTTSIFYDNKTNNPTIGTAGENKDIFLISLDIQGCSIIDMTRQDLFVLGFLIIRGCLFMIASIKEGSTGFYIKLFNREEKAVYTYTFNVGTDSSVDLAQRTNVVIDVANATEKHYDHFKIRSFRPSRATHLVFINNKDADIAAKFIEEERFMSNERNEFVYFDEDNMSDAMKKYLNDGYVAATIFTNLESVTDNQFGEYDDCITLMRSVFTVNNIILGGANPPAILKR